MLNDRKYEYCTEPVKDITGVKRRCKIKAMANNNICHIHKKKQKIVHNEKEVVHRNDEYLDRQFSHNLMNMYDSWKEIDVSERIELDNEIWPISIIINTFTNQLNNSNMENPYLIYPNNPFNRNSFTPKALINLATKIQSLKIPINVTLKLLLEQPEKILNNFYKESLKYLDRHSILLMALLQNHLRFMTINYKNSQNNYIGFWVRKHQKLTEFEKIYTRYNEASYQILNAGTIINNPYKEYLKYLLKDFLTDESKPTDSEYCEYLQKDMQLI